jgi:hypothetical protein
MRVPIGPSAALKCLFGANVGAKGTAFAPGIPTGISHRPFKPDVSSLILSKRGLPAVIHVVGTGVAPPTGAERPAVRASGEPQPSPAARIQTSGILPYPTPLPVGPPIQRRQTVPAVPCAAVHVCSAAPPANDNSSGSAPQEILGARRPGPRDERGLGNAAGEADAPESLWPGGQRGQLPSPRLCTGSSSAPAERRQRWRAESYARGA